MQVLLTGLAVDGAVTTAITECLASYACVTTFASYGCNLGDQVRVVCFALQMKVQHTAAVPGRKCACCLRCVQGLSAVAALLRASASKWWRGCKLSTLEIYADGRQVPAQLPASRHDATTITSSAAAGASTTVPADIPAVNATQLAQQQAGALQLPAAAAAATSKPPGSGRFSWDACTQASSTCNSSNSTAAGSAIKVVHQQDVQAVQHMPVGETCRVQ
jgi:hypothetical protein